MNNDPGTRRLYLGEGGLHSTMNNEPGTHRYLGGGGGGLHLTMNNDPGTHRYLGGGGGGMTFKPCTITQVLTGILGRTSRRVCAVP